MEVRFTIDLNKETRDQLKHISIVKETPMKEIVRELIEGYVSEAKEELYNEKRI